MQIFTHPNNKNLLMQIQESVKESQDKFGVRPIRPDGFEVIFDNFIPELCDSKTDFVSQADDRFTEFATSSPATWEVYFGFVKPVKVPHFLLMNPRRMTFMNPLSFLPTSENI
jgi:hypothetical protein